MRVDLNVYKCSWWLSVNASYAINNHFGTVMPVGAIAETMSGSVQRIFEIVIKHVTSWKIKSGFVRDFVFKMIHKNTWTMVKILQKSKTAKNVSKTHDIDIIVGKMSNFT